jgi:hypothetical protein
VFAVAINTTGSSKTVSVEDICGCRQSGELHCVKPSVLFLPICWLFLNSRYKQAVEVRIRGWPPILLDVYDFCKC